MAILLWSGSNAIIRILTESLGVLTAAAAVYCLSGVLSLAFVLLRPARRRTLASLPRKYLFGCGGLFVLYTLAYYAALGRAADRTQVLEVGLVNYLWPSLTVVLAVPLLGKRARWFLYPGAATAFAGVVLASMHQTGLSVSSLTTHLAASRLPYTAGLVAAVSWALYSNLCRRWGGDNQGGGVPIFFLASGLGIYGLRLILPEASQFTSKSIIELTCAVFFATTLPYMFWDHAMRRGNLVLVAVLSNFTPILSTLVSCAYLKVTPSPMILIAACLVAAGATTCNRAI